MFLSSCTTAASLIHRNLFLRKPQYSDKFLLILYSYLLIKKHYNIYVYVSCEITNKIKNKWKDM